MFCIIADDMNLNVAALIAAISVALIAGHYFIVRHLMVRQIHGRGAWFRNDFMADRFRFIVDKMLWLLFMVAVASLGIMLRDTMRIDPSLAALKNVATFYDQWSMPLFVLSCVMMWGLFQAVACSYVWVGAHTCLYGALLGGYLVATQACLIHYYIIFMAIGLSSCISLDMLARYERHYYKIRHGQA